MNEQIEVSKISSAKSLKSDSDSVTECIVLEVKSNTKEQNYADVEIKNKSEVLGKTRIMLFA